MPSSALGNASWTLPEQ